MVASEVASFETTFLRIAGTSEAETSVSGKAEYSLAISDDIKSKLFGVTFKVIPDAYCKLRTSPLKCTVKNFVLWIIAQIHFHLYEVQIFSKQPKLTILNYSGTLLIQLPMGHKNLTILTVWPY